MLILAGKEFHKGKREKSDVKSRNMFLKEIRTLYYPHQGHRLQFPSTPKTLQEQKKEWSFLSDKT